MAVDTEMTHPPPPEAEERRNAPQWETGLHRGLTRLDISNTPPRDRDSAGSWANETEHAIQAQGEQARVNQPTVRFREPPHPNYVTTSRRSPPRAYHQHTFSAPPISTTRESKRHGWYHGPPPHGHEAQGDGSADPRSRVERMVHPNVAAFAGFPAREAGNPQEQPDASSPEAMKRLEALVAVATSEGKTATAY